MNAPDSLSVQNFPSSPELSNSDSNGINNNTTAPKFGYHVYDLSRGIAQRFGAALLGSNLPQGVLHASIVIFGYEYFFEGNISKRPAGTSRFGKNFSFVPAPAPATAVSNDYEFDLWCRFMEMNRWGALAYHLTDHNCIHFVDHATRFLTQGKARAPALIRDNMVPVVSSAAGRLLFDVAKIMSATQMVKPAEDMHQRRLCRIQAAHVKKALQDKQNPKPIPIFAFGPSPSEDGSSSSSSRSRVDDLVALASTAVRLAFAPERILEREIRADRLRELVTLSGEAMQMSNGGGDLAGGDGEATTLSIALAQAFVARELCNSFEQMSLLLSLFSRLLLHEAFVQSVSCDLLFRQVLHRLGKNFFVPMPNTLKVQVLEVFCNLMCHPVTATPMSRLARTWLPTVMFLIARGLLEPTCWRVVHRASVLLHNFVYAHTTCNRTAVDAEVLSRGATHHPVIRLMGPAWFVAAKVVPNVAAPLVETGKEEIEQWVESCSTPEGAAKMNHERDMEKLNLLSQELAPGDPTTTTTPTRPRSVRFNSAAAGRTASENIRIAQDLDSVTQDILNNILQAMMVFTTQGHSANKLVQEHKMGVSVDFLVAKTKAGTAARAAAEGLSLIS